ncbi:MAG: hypothetical protein KF900_05820 [Bacteroidetes bacterium]|nr:hypothetical protein [Bacteroidota bacterium]
MKTLRWVLFAPVFLFYTTLPQHYAEQLSRWGWSLHPTTDMWLVKLFYLFLNFFISATSWSIFAVVAMYLIRIAPNTKLGGIILLLIIGTLILMSWILAWSSLDKIDIVFDVEILMILLAASSGAFKSN